MATEQNPRLLLVDDEPALLLSYRIILEQSGYQVDSASSSVEACKLLETNTYDLLLCDLGLEHSTAGLDVVHCAQGQAENLRCILMTGYLDDEIAERAERYHALTLAKPIEVPNLLSTLKHAIRKDKTA